MRGNAGPRCGCSDRPPEITRSAIPLTVSMLARVLAQVGKRPSSVAEEHLEGRDHSGKVTQKRNQPRCVFLIMG